MVGISSGIEYTTVGFLSGRYLKLIQRAYEVVKYSVINGVRLLITHCIYELLTNQLARTYAER